MPWIGRCEGRGKPRNLEPALHHQELVDAVERPRGKLQPAILKDAYGLAEVAGLVWLAQP